MVFRRHQPHDRSRIDSREEESTTVGLGSILPEHAQMISARRAFQTGSHISVAEIIAHFNGLVNSTVAITKVGRLRASQVQSEAFS
jgi:hypothetical protein